MKNIAIQHEPFFFGARTRARFPPVYTGMLRPTNRVIDRRETLRPIRFLKGFLIKERLLFTLRDNNDERIVERISSGIRGNGALDKME